MANAASKAAMFRQMMRRQMMRGAGPASKRRNGEITVLKLVLTKPGKGRTDAPCPILYCVLCARPRRPDGGGLCGKCRADIDLLWEVVKDDESAEKAGVPVQRPQLAKSERD